jgi:hypothetical protein
MPNIRHSIAIGALPELIYSLIASGHGFGQWWASDVTEDPATGKVEIGFFNRATVYCLQPVRSAQPGSVEWLCQSGQEWNGTRLLSELTHGHGRSLLRFTHSDWQAETEYFISCNTVWGELMFRLKAAAEGKRPGPLFSGTGMAY